ncbi:hypothetical protein ALC60_07893 [Trachymyrmex zeteki]|uniref:Uncharacterized protein n=2 Tax=Attini TaxID=143999 RepID=A0A151J6U6_9HYME|nr:hypothetical protein ALC57_08597 [Trachymyrmex cornetzi]KYQ53163.1 hypothetical protein ALC60_07893 [Trachymyrmex zeteki]
MHEIATRIHKIRSARRLYFRERDYCSSLTRGVCARATRTGDSLYRDSNRLRDFSHNTLEKDRENR